MLGKDIRMDITVRLYKLHDYDLIYLYKNLRYPVRDLMKKALISYVRNTPVKFDFPIDVPEEDELVNIKNSQFHIKLNEYTDADIIDFLLKLKPYYRNSFLKNLLRYYIAGPPVYVYLKDPDPDDTKYKIESIRENDREPEGYTLMKKRRKRAGLI